MTTAGIDEATLPEAPPVHGLRFRRFAGPADFPGMVAANMAARRAYGVLDFVTVESVAVQYGNLTNSDVARDLVIVELDDRIVGYARVEWADQHDGSRAYDTICLLEPAAEGQAIGAALLDWQEARLRAIAATHATDRPRWFQAHEWDRNARARSLLAARGYSAVRRSHEMVRRDLQNLPEAPLPEGLEVRPVSRDAMRAIWEADCEAFRDHWGESDESDAAWVRFRDEPTHDPDLFVVAFDGDQVAGFVLNTMDPSDTDASGGQRGLLDSVAVRRPWRRRGLAGALIARSLRLLRERGAASAYLGVDSENSNQAMTLYERNGFVVASSSTTYRKPIADEETPG